MLKSNQLTVLALLLSAILGAVAPRSERSLRMDGEPPSWVAAERARLLGTWIADNSPHRSAGEPYDAYGLEWKLAPDGESLIGRLFGLDEGQERGTMWEFRQHWHPVKKALWLVQYGADGTIGEGAIEQTSPTTTRLAQTFYARDGSSWQTGHIETHKDRLRTTQSFAIPPGKKWIAQRSYDWIKQAAPLADSTDPALGYQPKVLIQLAVADLDRAIEFYTKRMGFQLESRSDELEWARIKPGLPGLTIGLGRQKVVQGSATVSINLTVKDLKSARKKLEGRGVKFDGPTQEVPGVVRLADCMDPDGNRIRLAEDIE